VVRVIKIFEQKEINISDMLDNNNSDNYCAYQMEEINGGPLKSNKSTSSVISATCLFAVQIRKSFTFLTGKPSISHDLNSLIANSSVESR